MPCNKPDYLRQPAITHLLLRCLKRLDRIAPQERKQRIMESISASKFPTLFNPQESSADEILWHDLQQLASDGVISLERTKHSGRPADALPWEFQRIVFNSDWEQQVRLWLNLHDDSQRLQAWQDAVEQYKDHFTNRDLLAKPLFSELNKPAQEIIARLVKIPALLLRQTMTTYQLSAQLFWGHSKLLRDKESWLADLFGLPVEQILSRPIIVEVTFPSIPPTGLLIIENLDSYISAAEGYWPECESLILIYSQGFKVASSRIRTVGATHFHYNARQLPQAGVQLQFEDRWFARQNQSSDSQLDSWPIYMITDLDWSGMGIFKATQSCFPALEPWQPGYQAMLAAHRAGHCHHAAEADKSNQLTVESSGSDWLDKSVLPVLRDGCFVDQEIIHVEEIVQDNIVTY